MKGRPPIWYEIKYEDQECPNECSRDIERVQRNPCDNSLAERHCRLGFDVDVDIFLSLGGYVVKSIDSSGRQP